MLTIPDKPLDADELEEQLAEEESNFASIMFEEGWRSDDLPSKLAKQADQERVITTF